jgi:hypothetical protein
VTKITTCGPKIALLLKTLKIFFKARVTNLRSEFTQLKFSVMHGWLTRIAVFFSGSAILIVSACNKGGDDNGPYVLSYGNSILYLKNQPTDYIVYPTQQRAGTYSAFPEGIELDDNTGAINISDSETGLRYRITHTAPNGDTTSTVVLLSGIQFVDKFYNLSQNDSIASPIYNGSAINPVPITGSNFDENNNANSGGCSVTTTNGKINLAQTVRNGIFGAVPQNDVRKDFEIEYRLNDPSEKAKNKIKVRLYWYNTIADVPADIWEILNDRQTQGVFLGMNNTPSGTQNTARTGGTTATAKPRPPCVIIIGQ